MKNIRITKTAPWTLGGRTKVFEKDTVHEVPEHIGNQMLEHGYGVLADDAGKKNAKGPDENKAVETAPEDKAFDKDAALKEVKKLNFVQLKAWAETNLAVYAETGESFKEFGDRVAEVIANKE